MHLLLFCFPLKDKQTSKTNPRREEAQRRFSPSVSEPQVCCCCCGVYTLQREHHLLTLHT